MAKKIVLLIILISFTAGIYLYPKMPSQIVSHWNIKGEVDGYVSKSWGLFLMPFVSLFLFFLFLIIPRIDPLKSNIEKFRKYFEGFILLIILFLFYLYLLTIFWNLGARFNIIQFLSPGFSILFYYCGILMEKAKRNWFIGIRTPWTISSERVWDKTHKIAGKLFKVSGVLALPAIFLPDYALYFILFPVILFSIYTIIYSYLEYQK